MFDVTARTIEDAAVLIGDRVDILMNALVTRAYKTSERTATAKHGRIDAPSPFQNDESVATDQTVANTMSPYFVDQSWKTGVWTTTVHNGGFERYELLVAENVNTTAELASACEEEGNQMVVIRSQSAELRRRQQKQRKQQQLLPEREVEVESEPEKFCRRGY